MDYFGSAADLVTMIVILTPVAALWVAVMLEDDDNV